MSNHTLKDLEMPDDEPMVIIRSSLLWICDGDKYAAAALNMYVHWTRWLMKRKPVAQEINAMLKKRGQTPSQDTTYIIYRKQSYLIDDMLGFCSEKRLRQANALLTSKGLLKVEDTPRSISDHVLKYELQIDAFKKAMEAWRKHRESSNETTHDDVAEVSLEADLDGTDNLPLRDGKLSVPASTRSGKLSDSERSNDRDNSSTVIDDTHRNINRGSSKSAQSKTPALTTTTDTTRISSALRKRMGKLLTSEEQEWFERIWCHAKFIAEPNLSQTLAEYIQRFARTIPTVEKLNKLHSFTEKRLLANPRRNDDIVKPGNMAAALNDFLIAEQEQTLQNQPSDEQEEAATEERPGTVIWWTRKPEEAFIGDYRDHLNILEEMSVREAKRYNRVTNETYDYYARRYPDTLFYLAFTPEEEQEIKRLKEEADMPVKQA